MHDSAVYRVLFCAESVRVQYLLGNPCHFWFFDYIGFLLFVIGRLALSTGSVKGSVVNEKTWPHVRE